MTISCHFSVYLTYKDIQEQIRLKMFQKKNKILGIDWLTMAKMKDMSNEDLMELYKEYDRMLVEELNTFYNSKVDEKEGLNFRMSYEDNFVARNKSDSASPKKGTLQQKRHSLMIQQIMSQSEQPDPDLNFTTGLAQKLNYHTQAALKRRQNEVFLIRN